MTTAFQRKFPPGTWNMGPQPAPLPCPVCGDPMQRDEPLIEGGQIRELHSRQRCERGHYERRYDAATLTLESRVGDAVFLRSEFDGDKAKAAFAAKVAAAIREAKVASGEKE